MDRLEDVRKVFVTILVVVFGTGSWVAINGLWVELPLIVGMGVPEGYDLASQLIIVTQLANIGPVIFTVLSYLRRESHLETPAIFLILPVGISACLLLVFFWDVTTTVAGVERSIPFLSLAFFVSVVDCSSSVTFTPFMSRFKHHYLTWYFIGEGFSALLPSLVAIGQGVGQELCVENYTFANATTGENCTAWMNDIKPAHFSPRAFFGFLFAMMLVCMMSFFCLTSFPFAKREYSKEWTSKASIAVSRTAYPQEMRPMTEGVGVVDNPAIEYTSLDACEPQDPSDGGIIGTKVRKSRYSYALVLVLLAYVNAISNSVLPSIQSYSCGPYGIKVYHLAATLGSVVNPVAAFLVMLRPQNSISLSATTAFLGTVAGAYCLGTAAQSPAPPLQDHAAGPILVVMAWILALGLFTYTKATIGWILRNEPDNRRLLIAFGAVTQVGSFIGACVMFPLVNSLHLFTPYYHSACDDFLTCDSS